MNLVFHPLSVSGKNLNCLEVCGDDGHKVLNTDPASCNRRSLLLLVPPSSSTSLKGAFFLRGDGAQCSCFLQLGRHRPSSSPIQGAFAGPSPALSSPSPGELKISMSLTSSCIYSSKFCSLSFFPLVPWKCEPDKNEGCICLLCCNSPE